MIWNQKGCQRCGWEVARLGVGMVQRQVRGRCEWGTFRAMMKKISLIILDSCC